MDIFFFALFAFIAVICAINVVVQTHPIASALSLIGVMASLAVLYLLLGGEFIAMAQIIVYAGAVMVLFIFVIMLLNAGGESARKGSRFAKIAGIPLLAILLGLIAFYLAQQFPNAERVQFGVLKDAAGNSLGSAQNVGTAIFTTYLLPFEVTSVLILIAIIGAIVLARKELD
jgi:NADH-quinone oxidoreductase subunit J